ncbi:MAG: tetratricopeptide repeat protein [Cyanobacteriota bacterium]
MRPARFVVSSLLSLCAVLILEPSAMLAMVRQKSHSIGPVKSLAAEASDPALLEAAKEAEQLASAHYSAGRYEEALRAQQHSVQLHRELAAQDPSQRLQLAASLHNLGVVFIRLGRKTEAIPLTEESLSLYRLESAGQSGEVPLVLERPLRNLVLLYFETNRLQEALPLANDLVRIHQSMAAVDPLSQGERVDVLNLRASLLVALNRLKEAEQDLQVAVGLARSLAELAPQNLALQYGLAGTLVNLSQVADLLQRYPQALRPAIEAEALLRQMARRQPQFTGDWGKALRRLGQAFAKVGDPSRARPPLEESISLLRSLDRPSSAGSMAVEVGGYRDDLAHALESLGVVLQQLKRPEEARAAGQEAVEIYSVLAQVDHRYGRDVVRTESWLTTILRPTPAKP